MHTSLLANGLWSASCIAQGEFAGADFSAWRSPARGSAMRFLYRSADDRWLQFTMVRTPEEFERLLNVVGLLDLLDDLRFATPEARLSSGAALGQILADRLALHTSEHWMAAFAAARVPAALAGRLEDLPEDVQIVQNGMVLDATRTGTYPLINHPVNVADVPRAPPRPAPGLREHSATILGDLLRDRAPERFRVKFETTEGDFVVEFNRIWAPRGADRFYNLVTHGYYDDCKFFRVIPSVVVQWGIHGDTAVARAWSKAVILDDAVARRAAALLGIRFTGTLGILLEAKKQHLISAVAPLLDELERLRFRVSPATRAAVLKLAGESM